jgi:hypothetical protein
MNSNVVLVDTLCVRLINLHNELRAAERNQEAKPAPDYVELDEILDRYSMPGLKGTLKFSEDTQAIQE